MRAWILAIFMFLASACAAQDKVSISVTGQYGNSGQTGVLLEIPFGHWEIIGEASSNTKYGASATAAGAFWLNDRVAVWGGVDTSSGYAHDVFAGSVFAGKRWTTFLAYYPQARGATIYQEFEVHPKFWVGFYGGYLHGAMASATLRYELWEKR